MRKKIAIIFGIVALILAVLPGVASAATTGTVAPSATIETVLDLVMSGEANVQWASIVPPSTETGSVTATCKANVGWNLTVYKDDDLKNAGTDTLPTANFTFQSSGAVGPTYVVTDTEFPLVASPATVASDSSGTADAGVAVSVDYQLVTHLTDLADTYTALHTYTIAAT